MPRFIAKLQGTDSVEKGFTASNLNLLVTFPLVSAAIGGFASVPIQRRIGLGQSFSSSLQIQRPSPVEDFGIVRNPVESCRPVLTASSDFGISIANTASGLYLSEVAPPSIRA